MDKIVMDRRRTRRQLIIKNVDMGIAKVLIRFIPDLSP